jgi:ribosomal protein RSM22 (predicted rRNA methylase)
MALDRKRLVQAITERTALYTTEREKLPSAIGAEMPSTDLAARALFFGVADAAKISIPLQELAGRGLLPSGSSWRVLDLGAGAGAMGLGVLSFAADSHPGVGLKIDAVDLDDKALSLYREALDNLNQRDVDLAASEIQTITASAIDYRIEEGAYDLVVAGTLLNELSEAAASKLAQRAIKGVSEGGALILIEPALRDTSRALHRVRDALISSEATIFAPCTRAQAPCPALADESDWCHEDRPGVLPSRARQLAAITGLRDGGLKFSYLVARHGTEKLVASEERAWRVVSQPQRGKGQRECFACGDLGRHRVRLLKRNRTSANRVFDRARRGDVLLADVDAPPEAARIEISKNQTVDLIRPALLTDD